jgi:hypothetical protein
MLTPRERLCPENAAAMIRSASTAFVLALCCLAALPAEARKKAKPVDAESSDDSGAGSSKTSKSAKADKPDSGKPVQIASFGDWGAYLAKGKGKTCYTLASPKERKPDIKRPAAYVFIADRPAEKVKNEVSIIMGFPMKESAPAQAKVGTTSFDLVAKGANAWIKDPADESKFVESLRHAAKLVVKAVPTHGPGTTDTYVLTGFKQALDRVTKECK